MVLGETPFSNFIRKIADQVSKKFTPVAMSLQLLHNGANEDADSKHHLRGTERVALHLSNSSAGEHSAALEE
jgi:hypothetical protein